MLAFLSFSALLYADKISCPYPSLCDCEKSKACPSGKLNGSEFMLSLQPFSSAHLNPDHFPSLLAVFLFFLYPVALFAGYALALAFSKRSRKPSPGSYSRDEVKSYLRISNDPLTKNPRYSIVRYPDSQKGVNNLKEAIDRSIQLVHKDGIKHFVKPGNKVLIKVNVCGGNSINPASFTSLDVLDHVVDSVLDAEAAQVLICDADMIWTKFWPAIHAMKPRWDEWVKKKGEKVKLVNLSETELVYFDFGDDTVFQENERPNQEVVSKEMLEADVIINIPTMKMHQFTSVTLGMKNMYGTLPKVDKFYYHEKGLEGVIYWINWAFSPTLTIIDGSLGGEAWGPLDPTAIEYKTIVASNNVVWADAIAAKLMGFDPFNEIPYLRMARDKMGEARSLLQSIPKEIYFTPDQLVSKWGLPPHTKDGNWQKADPQVQEQMFNLITRLQVVPGMVTFCNLIGDFIMWDASRLPLLKILQSAILQFLYESPRYWIDRKKQTIASKNRKLLNLAIVGIIAFLSMVVFVNNGYLVPWAYDLSFNSTLVKPEFHYPSLNSYIIYLIGFLLVIAFSAFFAMRMKTRYLVAIILSSFVVGYLVESYAPLSWWWRYLHEAQAKMIDGLLAQPPYYPLFVIPLFILTIIGLAHFISPAFACLGLKGRRFRLVPYAVIMLSLVSFLSLEGYFEHIEINIIIIYAALAILALHFNERNRLELNIAMVVVAVAAGFIMEYFGAVAGYWTYPRVLFNFSSFNFSNQNFYLKMIQDNLNLSDSYKNTYVFNFTNISNHTHSLVTLNSSLWKNEPIPFTKMPIFVSLSWALNVWAACGLALLFRMNMSRAFVRDATFDPNDPQAYIHRGDDCRRKHKYPKALTCYEKAIEMLSSKPEVDGSIEEYCHPAVLNRPLALGDAWYGKAVALASIYNFKDAKEAYEQSIRQYLEAYPEIPVTKIAHARHRKAVALQNLAFQDCSRMGAAQREEIDLKSKEALCAYKEALCAYDEALEACEQALRTNPEALDLYADIWIDKALMLQQMGEPDKCLEVYNNAIVDKAFKNHPHKLAELHDFRGFAKIYQADHFLLEDGYDKAKEDFEKAGKLAKKVGDKMWQAFAVWGGGCILERKGQYSEAKQCFQMSLLDLSPKDPAFIRDDLGDALLDQDKCDKALDAYETALQDFSDLENIEIEQAWRGRSLMLIKLVAHAWEGKGDSHRCQGENLKPEQEKLQKEKEDLERQLAEIKRKQKQEDTKQEQKSPEQETLEHRIDGLKQKLEDLKQEAESQADRSFKAYRQAVECLDKLTLDSDAMSSRGHVLSKMMRHGEALDSYDKAIINSNSWPKELASILRAKALIGKGNVLFETGKHEEALRCYKKAMEAFPGCKPCLIGKCSDLEKIAGGAKGPARDEAAAILQKIKETGQAKQEESLEKAAGVRICSEAWQDREMYLSLMRYLN